MGGKVAKGNLVTSLMLPRPLQRWLAEESAAHGVSRSAIARAAIALFQAQPSHVRRAVLRDQREEADGAEGEASPSAPATGPPARLRT